MDIELTKLYYSIGEVANMFHVSSSLLRYWQKEFPGLKPGTNRKGDRKYTKKDILYIEEIYDLVKNKAFTLEGARQELKKKKIKTKSSQSILENLHKIKKDLKKLREEL